MDYSHQLDDLNCKTILILGLGREGISTLRFLAQHLVTPRFILADRNLKALDSEELSALVETLRGRGTNLSLECGPQYLANLTTADVLIRSAGIPVDLPELLQFRSSGGTVLSNTGLFFRLSKSRKIGVTGTKGKSTTTSLIFHLLKANGIDARLVGNIGIPPLDILTLPETPDTVFVIEMSSFQLADLGTSPEFAVLQNIAPEHLDNHKTFENYLSAKAQITASQSATGLLIYNHDSATASLVASKSQAKRLSFGFNPPPEIGCYVENDQIILCRGVQQEVLANVSKVPLIGRFNLVNTMPALLIGHHFGLNQTQLESALGTFKPLAHRLEPCGRLNGVSFYNDSLSTVPEAAVAALSAFSGQPIVLIAGGFDRGLDYSILGSTLANSNLRALVLFRPTGPRIEVSLKACSQSVLPPIVYVENMHEAVKQAIHFASSGDIVLLSPASASFGLFRDYQERGDRFKEEINGSIDKMLI